MAQAKWIRPLHQDSSKWWMTAKMLHSHGSQVGWVLKRLIRCFGTLLVARSIQVLVFPLPLPKCFDLMFFNDHDLLICTHCQELMKSVETNGSSLLLFRMIVAVWHFVSDTHKVMTALHLVVLVFDIVGTDRIATFRVLLWSFLWILLDISFSFTVRITFSILLNMLLYSYLCYISMKNLWFMFAINFCEQ